MTDKIEETFSKLDKCLKRASIAQIGGFRPPTDPRASWFAKGVGLPDEPLPTYKGVSMFPLLQVNCDELPYRPKELEATRLLVVFFNRVEIPFNKPHGDGWVVREYQDLESLVPLPDSRPERVRPFPIKWTLKEDEGPDWEDAWGLVDLAPINESEEAAHQFFDRYHNHSVRRSAVIPARFNMGPCAGRSFFKLVARKSPTGCGLTTESHTSASLPMGSGGSVASSTRRRDSIMGYEVHMKRDNDTPIQTVVFLLKKQIPTLVDCGAGMSRSPAVVAAALSIVQGGSPDERLKEIVAGHPHDVSPQLWEVVCRACSKRE